MPIDVDRLKNIFEYSAETGKLIWRKPTGNRVKVGANAGCYTHNGYLVVMVDNVLYYVHQIVYAMNTGKWPEREIDHYDRNRANNKFSNLFEVNSSINKLNKAKIRKPKNPDLPRGVTKIVKASKIWYKAQCKKHGKNYNIGLYEKIEDARNAYLEKVSELYGDVYLANV